jgi:pilus assembly protein Flp/PilA
MKHLIRGASEQSGAAAIEYALILAGIALAIVIILQSLGGELSAVFDSLSNSLP